MSIHEELEIEYLYEDSEDENGGGDVINIPYERKSLDNHTSISLPFIDIDKNEENVLWRMMKRILSLENFCRGQALNIWISDKNTINIILEYLDIEENETSLR